MDFFSPKAVPAIEKGAIDSVDSSPPTPEENAPEFAEWEAKGASSADVLDLLRMGKKQELFRGFRFISMVAFLMLLMSSWESAMIVAYYGLYAGGSAGMIWLFIASFFCVLCLVASIAEMASMAPTAGGQYHWTSEFAPKSIQKPLSYFVGWMAFLGWVSGIPSCTQLLSTMIQGLVWLKNPKANIGANWQTTLLIYAFLVLIFFYNIFLFKTLPALEIALLVVHVVGFFVFIGVLWTSDNIAPADQIFTVVTDDLGWNNKGLTVLTGIIVPLWSFVGPDSAAHMSEETRDAAKYLPRAIMLSTVLNGIMAIIMLITFCFCIGDVNTVLNSATGYPIIQVVYNITKSYTGTVFMTLILLLVSFIAAIAVVAATSRQMWSFARDKGFPGHRWLAKVSPTLNLPINALITIFIISIAISSLNFGSPVALGAILSVSNAALVFSYMVSIGCMRIKRLRGEPLLPCAWGLGRWGWLVNDIALGFLLISFVFSFFPETPNPAPADMNWAIAMFGGVGIIAGVDYLFRARFDYTGPVALIKQE